MTDFEKRVNEYMQCDKKTLAELLALRDLNNITPIEEPKTPLRDMQFPPYQPMPNIQPNTPNTGDKLPNYPWYPNGPWGPIVWCETNTQYIN
jgi:hypothetical protein